MVMPCVCRPLLAMPSSLSFSITCAARAEFSASASEAVFASVTTARRRRATSGFTCTWPWPLTVSVPVMVVLLAIVVSSRSVVLGSGSIRGSGGNSTTLRRRLTAARETLGAALGGGLGEAAILVRHEGQRRNLRGRERRVHGHEG